MSGEWQFTDSYFGGSDYPTEFDNPKGKEVHQSMTKTKVLKKTGKKAIKRVTKAKR